MSKSYVIQWKSMINGRAGKGTKVFEWEQAQELAEELNREYPDIQHEPVETDVQTESATEIEPAAETSAGPETPQVAHDPDHVLSFQ